MYNSAIWPSMNKIEHELFHDGIMKLYRLITGMQTLATNLATHSDVQVVVVALHASTPEELLTASRLRYVRRLFLHGPVQLWAIIKANFSFRNSWLGLVVSDLSWFFEHLPASWNLPDPLDHLDQ